MKLIGFCPNVVLWSQYYVPCITPPCVLYIINAKRDFGRRLAKWNPVLRVFEYFFEDFKPNRHGMVQTSFGM